MIILISIIVFLVLFISAAYVCALRAINHRNESKISFKESLDLIELPIVTFYSGDIKLHFLLDTGSNISYINKNILKDLNCIKLGKESCIIAAEGGSLKADHYLIDIKYKNQEFTEEFGAVDLSSAFSAIEEEGGIRLHGILGNKFFEKYKYIIDFKELAAYR